MYRLATPLEINYKAQRFRWFFYFRFRLNLHGKAIQNGTNIRFCLIYTASGQKLAQVVSDKGILKQTDYIGEYIYQNDTLQFINHEEGRVVMTGDDPEYQYHLKDHLGNVRVTFTTKEEVEAPTATLETANQASDQANFLRYEEARKVSHYLFDKTNDTLLTQVEGYAQRLNGSINERFGLARSLAVMPGDKINTEVFAKYIDRDTSNWSVALNTLLSQIAAGTTTGGTVIDGASIYTEKRYKMVRMFVSVSPPTVKMMSMGALRPNVYS